MLLTQDNDNPDELPLLKLFTSLRESGLTLGIDEYHLLLQAWQAGFGLGDKESLARVCQTLWVKSSEEEHLFKYHFNRLIEESQFPALSEQNLPKSNTVKPKVKLGTDIISDDVESPDSSKITQKSSAAGSSEIQDEVQVAEAIKLAAEPEKSPDNRFLESDEFFPITRRQMKQSWRYLRRLIREGSRTELDIEATAYQIARQGQLLELVMVPERRNQVELMLLIDRRGSMVPFHLLAKRLAQTAQQGGRLGEANIYYFHNFPHQCLYQDIFHQKPEKITDLFIRLHSERSVVLVFSDAGAARGSMNPKRLGSTLVFLAQLKRYARRIAWLNPMPKERWSGSTAKEIARHIPMFEVNRRGLDSVVATLRGRRNSSQFSRHRNQPQLK